MSTATILGIAARQGGIVLRRQVLEAGKAASWANRRVASGEWQRVSEGVFRVFGATDDIDLLRGAVAALPAAVVSHGSAALAHGLSGAPPSRPNVTVHAKTTHEFPGVAVRRSRTLTDDQVVQVDGLPTTSVARTLLDLAADIEPTRWGRVADRAIGDRKVAVSAFRELAGELCGRGRPGSGTVRAFLEAGDLGASVLERRALSLLRTAGLPEPKREYPIPWSPDLRFDLAYPGSRLAIELDGRRFHDRPDKFETDRKRDRTAVEHRWTVVRFTWRDLERRPDEFVRTVASLLESKRGLSGANPHH